MSIFKRKKPVSVIIVGCGRLGSALAEMLYDDNYLVTVIDNDENAFRKLSQLYGGFTLVGDGCDPDVLTEAGLNNAAILIATTDDDNSNMMIAQMGQKEFNVAKVIARIYDTSKQSACIDKNIHFICPAILSIEEFKKIILHQEVAGL